MTRTDGHGAPRRPSFAGTLRLTIRAAGAGGWPLRVAFVLMAGLYVPCGLLDLLITPDPEALGLDSVFPLGLCVVLARVGQPVVAAFAQAHMLVRLGAADRTVSPARRVFRRPGAVVAVAGVEAGIAHVVLAFALPLLDLAHTQAPDSALRPLSAADLVGA